VIAGGFGSAVREVLDREKKFDIRFKAIGIPESIYPMGSADQIKQMFKLDTEGLKAQIRDFYG
jgi:1-deoxy-D-xylulose-5-phosphate synthase